MSRTVCITFTVVIHDIAALEAAANSLPDYDPDADTPLKAVIQSDIAPLDAGFEIVSVVED